MKLPYIFYAESRKPIPMPVLQIRKNNHHMKELAKRRRTRPKMSEAKNIGSVNRGRVRNQKDIFDIITLSGVHEAPREPSLKKEHNSSALRHWSLKPNIVPFTIRDPTGSEIYVKSMQQIKRCDSKYPRHVTISAGPVGKRHNFVVCQSLRVSARLKSWRLFSYK